MKKTKILYWVTTAIIVAFDGLIPTLTFNSQLAKEGISHLGYPDYFRIVLTVFKVAGALILILPVFTARLKEWAYAGFAFIFMMASISHFAVDGINFQSFFPLLFFAILAVSYTSYHKLSSAKNQAYNFQHA